MINFRCIFLLLVAVFGTSNFLNFRENSHLEPYANKYLDKNQIVLNEFFSFMSALQLLFYQNSYRQKLTTMYDDYHSLLSAERYSLPLTIRQLGYSSILTEVDPLQMAFMTKILAVHYHLYPNKGLNDTKDYPRIILKLHLYMKQLTLMSRRKKKDHKLAISRKLTKKIDCGLLVAMVSLHNVFLNKSRTSSKRFYLLASLNAFESYPIFKELEPRLSKLCLPPKSLAVNRHRSQKIMAGQTGKAVIMFALFVALCYWIFVFYFSQGRQFDRTLRVHPLV